MKKQPQSIFDIWDRRLKLLENKTWNGDDPRTGWDLQHDKNTNLHEFYNRKYSSNWSDLTIRDFRNILICLESGVFPNELDETRFTIDNINTSSASDKYPIWKLTDKQCKIDILSISSIQKYFMINNIENNCIFSVSWYKDRGSIDCIINCEHGKSITIEEMTDLLVSLGLEEDYEYDL